MMKFIRNVATVVPVLIMCLCYNLKTGPVTAQT